MIDTVIPYNRLFLLLLSAVFMMGARGLVAQSVPWMLAGPYGGGVSSIVSTDNSLFLTRWGNAVFKSTDNGDTWQQVPFQFRQSAWATRLLTHNSLLFVMGRSLYRSTDDGDTWTELNPAQGSYNYRLCFIGDTLYAATHEGHIYKSFDYGTSWQLVWGVEGHSRGDGIYTFDSHEKTLFLGIDNELHRSDNGGYTWRVVNTVGNRGSVNSFAAHDPMLVVAVAGAPGPKYNQIYYSSDFGETWSAGDEGLTAHIITSVIWDGSRFIASGEINGGVFVSSNGANWQKIGGEFVENVNVVYASKGRLFTGSTYSRYADSIAPYDAGIYRSTDRGETWQFSSRGFSSIEISGIAEYGGMLFAVGWDGVYMSRDNGAEWRGLSSEPVFEGGVGIASTGDALLAGMADLSGALSIHRTADTGKTWVNTGLHIGPESMIAASGNLVVAVSGSWVTHKYTFYSSIDGGVTWSPRAMPPLSSSLMNRVPGIEFLGDTLFLAAGDSVYRSLDTGTTWELMSNGLSNPNVIALKNVNGVLFAGASTSDQSALSIFRSSDKGNSWQPVYSSNSAYDEITSFTSQGNTIIASFRNGGMLISRDQGNTWEPFNNGLINKGITTVKFAGGSILAAAGGGGIYRTTTTSSVNSGRGTVVTAALYPNPCHGLATIRYDVPSATITGRIPVVLSLHNVLGEVVAVPLSQYQAPGSYSMEVDVSELVPGTYFYQVKAGERCETGSFIVMDR